MRLRALALCLLVLPVGCVAGADDFEEEGEEEVGSSEDSFSSAARRAEFEDADELTMTTAEREEALARYASLDHGDVREELYERAVLFFDKNQDVIRNKSWLGIIDFAQHSRERRFVVIDMNGGPARSFVVAHGSGSDPDHDGYATRFGNTPNSHMSSLGFYETAEQYVGKYGRSLRLDGLSSTNDNARRRAIVLHQAPYVNDGAAKQGRSQGCPAVDPGDRAWIVANMANGAILYASN